MDRRKVILFISASFCGSLGRVFAQSTKVYRVGLLDIASTNANRPNLEALLRGLREAGYVEGKNLIVDYRSAEGRSDGFAQLAKDRSTDTQSSADGGELGCTSKGSFVPEFEDAVLGAKTGDTLGPVKTTYGYHIIRVDKAYGLQPLDDTLRASIATTLNNEQGWLSWKAYSSKISVNKKYGSWSNDQISVIPPADPTVK